jgi:xylulokinase
MAPELVLGLDVSTTATKAVLVAADGSVVAVGTAEYPFETPRPGWTEQHPDVWWRATQQAVRSALSQASIRGDAVAGVGLTGQMHGSVLLDDDGRPVRPAILWNDQRTAQQCQRIRERIGPERLVRLTGNDALTGFTAPKLLWVREHEPAVWGRTRHVLLPKDYVRLRLTGSLATDVADASGTLLLDVPARNWSAEVLSRLDLDPGLLPDLLEGPAHSGDISAEAAAASGLAAGTPVVAGGGDQAANAVGLGAVTAEVGALSLGTSGVVFLPTSAPVIEPEGRVHSFCHAVPNTWHVMGVMLSAAGSLRWFRDAVAPHMSFADLVLEAETVEPGADGLTFLPYLTGERTPHADPAARGAFVGLTVRHTRAHMTRSVLEGVAFGLRDGLELMKAAGVTLPPQLRASGGGTRSQLWRQVVADVLGVTVCTTSTVEGAAFGAAALAMVEAGWFERVESATRLVREVEANEPAEGDRYLTGYATYRALYPALAPTFARTAATSQGAPPT